MIKVVIWGCRDGEYLYQQMQESNACKYQVVAMADNASKYQETEIQGVPVINLDILSKKYQAGEVDKIIITVRKGYSRYCILKELQRSGIEITDIILMRPSPFIFKLPICFDEENEIYNKQWYFITEENKDTVIIHHLESNLADGCNLNYKGCLHFSNLYKRDDFPDEDAILEGIKSIAGHCEVFQFRILGGEPLLNKNLPNFIMRLREILPNTDIAIISNGILIPKTENVLFEVMKKCNVGFILTLYQPTLKMKDMIYNRLLENGVPYGSHEAKTELFEKFLLLEPESVDKHPYKACEPRGILVLKEQFLYRCPVEAYIGKYCETYGVHMDIPDGIDVLDTDIKWDNLIDKLYTEPRSLCKYCSNKSDFYEWGNSKAEKMDWIVENK